MQATEKLSPIENKEQAKDMLEYYFTEGWTLQDYEKDLARLLYLCLLYTSDAADE